VLVAASSLVLPISAQEADSFATGFDLLRKLGVPSTEGARWTRAKDDSQARFTRTFADLEIELKGSGWTLPDDQFIATAGLRISTPPGEDAEKDEEPGVVASVLGRMLKAHQEKHPEDKPAPLPEKKPDDGSELLEKDVKTIIDALSDSDAADELRRLVEYGRGQSIGSLLIFAAQIDQAGHKQLAHDLTEALFNSNPNRDAVIDAAVSLLADDQYDLIWSQFQEDHDWQAYHRGTLALLEKFPRGWSSRAATAMLVPALEKRASGAAVPPIEIPGTPLSPKALQILGRLHEAMAKPGTPELPEGLDLSQIPVQLRAQVLANYGGNSGFDIDSLGLWLLPQAAEEEGEEEESSDDPRIAITRIGIDAIPALAALLGDSTLTHFPNESGSFGSYYSSSEDEMSRTLRVYRSMNRPTSRAEIASGILAAVIPSGDEESGSSFDSSAPEDLREPALEFWKKHRESNAVELCREYLSTGNSQQKFYAGQFLAESKDPAAAAVFETAVLESPEPLEMLSLVESYLTQRKAAGRPFFEKFSKLLREFETEDESDLPWPLRQSGGVEGTIRKLGILVGASSVEELISSALKSKEAQESPKEMALALSNTLRTIPVADLIHPMAKAITTAPKELHLYLLQACVSGLWGNPNRDETPPEFDDAAKSAWSALLADDSPLPLDDQAKWFEYYDMDRMSSASAFLVELIVDPSVSDTFRIHKGAHDEDSGDILLRRARARLAGSEIPPFTSSQGVAEKRVKEIQALAETLSSPLELAETVRALPPSEKAAWIEGFSKWREEEEPVPELLLTSRMVITDLTEPADKDPLPAEILEKIEVKPGRKIDLALFEDGCRILLENASAWSGSVIDLNADPLGIGLTAGGTRHGDDDSLSLLADHEVVIESDADAFALGYAYDSDECLIWSIKDGKITLLTEIGEDEKNPIAHILGQISSSKGLYHPQGQLIVLQREDLEKYRTPDE
jgi:hypothetical protein